MTTNKPYIWLEDFSTQNLRLYFTIDLASQKVLTGPTIDDTTVANTRLMTYQIVDNPAGTSPQEYSYDHNKRTLYDSGLDHISVIIKDTTQVKGKGTANQSEADQSGGGTEKMLRPFLRHLP